MWTPQPEPVNQDTVYVGVALSATIIAGHVAIVRRDPAGFAQTVALRAILLHLHPKATTAIPVEWAARLDKRSRGE